MHTAEADIRLRAQYLAEAQRALSAGPTSPRKSLGIRVGGDEDGVRRSHDHDLISRFQREENIQESVRDMLTRAKLMYRKYPSWSRDGQLDHRLEEVKGAVAFQSAYLAVSPPVGLMTRLASMSFTNPLSPLWMQRSETVPRTDQELTSNPTLVIYGDRDRFISYRKMHDWTRQLSGLEASQFRHIEVPEAGHFWTESVVVYQRESY
jgi:pimeloyl-ACP methyl ester carboxylesterase